MGYGSPRLGIHPDWQCDWVSGKTWPPPKTPGKYASFATADPDVKAPWELSRLQ